MKFPTMDEFAKNVAEKALDEYEYKGKTLRQWIEIILATDNNVGTKVGTNLAEVGTDCISRRAATDALRKMQTYKMFSGDDMLLIDQAGAMTELMLLPPAEPKIIRCKDCKNWDTTWTNDFSPNYHYCPMVDGVRKEDWFCADAERRTE